MWNALATVYEAQGDVDNAIRSHERAIQGADRAQMVGILAKLASLHHSLAGDFNAGADARAASGGGIGRAKGGSGRGKKSDTGLLRRMAQMDKEERADRVKAIEHATKSAAWHQQLITLGEADGLGVGDLAPSYVAVAEWEMRHVIKRMHAYVDDRSPGEGDLALASLYLEKVKGTTVPQGDAAEEMYRHLKLLEATLL